MGSEEERPLPYLCECGDVGCERCVPATVAEYEADALFAPGHEPEQPAGASVTEIERRRRNRDRRQLDARDGHRR
jgi:hypothetical protein